MELTKSQVEVDDSQVEVDEYDFCSFRKVEGGKAVDAGNSN